VPRCSAYLSANPYLGATVGRYANRIAGARFTLDGVTHQLTPNEGDTCLHGGVQGFHSRLWTVVEHGEDYVTMELVSPDGDQGFPGEITAHATYRVTQDTVTIELSATSDAPTVVSLTNHTYFNFAGSAAGTVDGHALSVEATRTCPSTRVHPSRAPRGRRRNAIGLHRPRSDRAPGPARSSAGGPSLRYRPRLRPEGRGRLGLGGHAVQPPHSTRASVARYRERRSAYYSPGEPNGSVVRNRRIISSYASILTAEIQGRHVLLPSPLPRAPKPVPSNIGSSISHQLTSRPSS